MTTGDGASAATVHPLALWAERLLLAGIALLGLGTMLVILGVDAGGLVLPGVSVLGVALLVLAASGVLAALTPDA
jgi:hypothetical protein